MKRTFLSAVIAAIALAVPVAAHAQGKTITLDSTKVNAQSSQIAVHVGDTLIVRLPTKAGPEYAWQLEQNNPNLLRQQENPTVKVSAPTNGQSFRFLVVGTGSQKLLFNYVNAAQESDRAAETFQTLVSIAPKSVAKGAGQPVIVTNDDEGKRVTINQGDTLIVRLTVTSGVRYRWNAVSNNAMILQPLDTSVVRFGAANLGSLPKQEFSYTATGSGSVNLQFQQRSVKAGSPPGNTFRILVFVQGQPDEPDAYVAPVAKQ